MKRNEIIPAAEAFITNHHDYAQQWERSWTNALAKFTAADDALTETHGVPHPIWNKFTEEEIVNLFQDFWEGLPDSRSIHGPGFHAVCDIAENIFGFDDEDAEDTEDPT